MKGDRGGGWVITPSSRAAAKHKVTAAPRWRKGRTRCLVLGISLAEELFGSQEQRSASAAFLCLNGFSCRTLPLLDFSYRSVYLSE